MAGIESTRTPSRSKTIALARNRSASRVALIRGLRVRERLVELRRARHRELVRSAFEPLLRVLAGRLEMEHAVVPDHRERERMRDAGVLHAIEEERSLGTV